MKNPHPATPLDQFRGNITDREFMGQNQVLFTVRDRDSIPSTVCEALSQRLLIAAACQPAAHETSRAVQVQGQGAAPGALT